jgi:hypothetical protein
MANEFRKARQAAEIRDRNRERSGGDRAAELITAEQKDAVFKRMCGALTQGSMWEVAKAILVKIDAQYGIAFARLKTYATVADVSTKTVQRTIDALKKADLLNATRRRGAQLLWCPELMDMTATEAKRRFYLLRDQKRAGGRTQLGTARQMSTHVSTLACNVHSRVDTISPRVDMSTLNTVTTAQRTAGDRGVAPLERPPDAPTPAARTSGAEARSCQGEQGHLVEDEAAKLRIDFVTALTATYGCSAADAIAAVKALEESSMASQPPPVRELLSSAPNVFATREGATGGPSELSTEHTGRRGRKKGAPKTGGRKKGTLNRISRRLLADQAGIAELKRIVSDKRESPAVRQKAAGILFNGDFVIARGRQGARSVVRQAGGAS